MAEVYYTTRIGGDGNLQIFISGVYQHDCAQERKTGDRNGIYTKYINSRE
jgi:hypothetical protein